MSRLIALLFLGFVLWLLYWLAVAHLHPVLANRGLFGDSFGAFSSLATALAFAGTSYAIYRQDEAARKQDLQIQTQAELEARTALALERNSTIELVRVLSGMREKNASDIATALAFVRQFAADSDAASAINESKESLRRLFKSQGLLNKAHHDSLSMLIKAWNLPPELAESIVELTSGGDYSGWNEVVDRLASQAKDK